MAVAVAQPILLGSQGGAQAAPAAGNGSWGSVLDWGLQGKHMSVLSSGKVIVWSNGASARIWDPAKGAFTANTPATFGDLHCAGNAQTADGRLVVMGGQNGATHVGTPVTALFDPATETWTQGASMSYSRWYPSVTTMGNGKVLVTSGDDATGKRITTPEVYSPDSDSWTKLSTGTRTQGLYPQMYQLPNGKVFEAAPEAQTAILDPSGTGSWSPGPVNAWGTNGYSESSAMYEPGKILRAGGGDPAISRTAVIDMNAATPKWTETAPMAFPRRRMNLTIMADGELLAVGGTAAGDDEAKAALPAEIWNPETKTWRTVAAMSEARMYHSSAVLLPDGRILSAGGEATGRLHAQIYSPPYLSAGPRPTITSAPATSAFGSSISISSPDAASITSVAMIRLDSATHAWDQNQRYVPLTYTQSGNTLTAKAPANGNIAPPGDYQLIIKNGDGVPSVAKIIRVASAGALQPATVTGTVTNQNGTAVAGATVASSGVSTTTDSTGGYQLTGLSGGERPVTVSAAGYATISKTVTLTAGGTVTASFQLSPPGQVAGTVTSTKSGSPIAGAEITYPGGSTAADDNGRYTISNVPAGTLSITATAIGYTSLTQDVTVTSGSTTAADLALANAATYVTGGVLDPNGDGIANAPVSISTGATTTTDSLGRYRFYVDPGTYTVTAQAPGYTKQSADAIVTSTGYTVLDFPMQPATGTSTTLKHITLENSSLTDATTGADKVVGTVTRDTGSPLSGTASAQLSAATGAYLEENVAATDDLWVSALVRPASLPTGDSRLLYILNGSTAVGTLQLRANGHLRLRSGSTTVGSESAALTAGTTYRIGVHQTKGAGGNAVLEAYVAPAGSSFGAPFAKSTTGTWTTGATRVRVGSTSGPALSASLDNVFLDSGAFGDDSGSSTPTPTPTPTPPSGGMTMTYSADADANVKSTSPTKNYGTATTLRLRAGTSASPDSYKSYLRFNVDDIMGTVTSAKLRLYVTDGSKVGGSVFPTSAGWTETGINAANAPADPTGPPLATVGVAPANGWVEYDVTKAVTGEGVYAFMLNTTSSDSVTFTSREGTAAQAPQLVVTHTQ